MVLLDKKYRLSLLSSSDFKGKRSFSFCNKQNRKLVWCILSTSNGSALPEKDELESIDDIDESELEETDRKRAAVSDEDDLDEINDIDERDVEENDHRVEKRWGKVRLTKLVLKKLARDLRRNGSLARRAARRLESWTGGRLSANRITAVIEGVAARLDRYETATCNFFASVASRFGQSSSQIDYILTNNKDIYCNHEIWENTSSNVSSHVPVSMVTNIAVPLLENFSNQNKKTVQRLKWNEIDEQLYRDTISEKLTDIREDKTTSENIKTLTSILLKASHLAVPTKMTKLKGPKWKASPKVRKHLKTCKQLYSKWKALGKPENHQSKQDLKIEKKKLRSQQRQEHATDRRKLYEQIMDNPSSELFFKLINRNKSKSKTETSGLEIDGKFDFSSQNQSRAFKLLRRSQPSKRELI
ncbi:unnamed protein product [Mytilus edulis]|uniref:Uncharacterized protein n=1 Tax=Mytilus edulis TaxID=6550 RepID=A0A8S3UK39_MYTED|nr:unnamed protein product [Mytilus edulis]